MEYFEKVAAYEDKIMEKVAITRAQELFNARKIQNPKNVRKLYEAGMIKVGPKLDSRHLSGKTIQRMYTEGVPPITQPVDRILGVKRGTVKASGRTRYAQPLENRIGFSNLAYKYNANGERKIVHPRSKEQARYNQGARSLNMSSARLRNSTMKMHKAMQRHKDTIANLTALANKWSKGPDL